MAIEIIPKKKEAAPPWQIIIFSILILLLLLAIVFYFFLLNQEKKYQTKINELKTIIEKEREKEEAKIKELSEIKEKISIFSKLTEDHFFISKVFEILSQNTHPKVFYKTFDLSPEKNKISLLGETDNFFILGQQVLILKENPLIQEIKISKISKTKEGKVEFGFDLILSPEIFKNI